MPRGQVETPEQYLEWVLNLVKDLRAPDEGGTKIVSKDGEQRKREYEDAKEAAARTGKPEDIKEAKRLKSIVEILDRVEKARKLTTQAQDLYENIDANRKKLKALKELGEGNSDEAKKVQRQLERARGGLKEIETQRDAYGPNPKASAVQKAVAQTKTEKVPASTPAATPATPSSEKPAKSNKGAGTGSGAGAGAGSGKETAKEPTAEEKQTKASGIINTPDLGLSETLFKNVPSLKTIYDEYVDPKSGMTDEEFIKRIRQDTWFLKNSREIRARFTQFYNYQDLVNSGQADGSTDYEQQIAKIESRLKKRAGELGSAAASDPAALRKAAENLYITNKSEDESYITDFLASAIRPVSGMIGGKVTEGYSGQALQNYNALLQAARNNGFQIKDILPGAQNEQQVLGAIARGEIDINRVAQDARKLAAQGQPQYVRDLLSQGYNLNQVYAPYRQQMAAVLELPDPDQIDLNDPILRSAITDKGDMNLYDFKKALRQDSRWQYTENAKQEVSDAALGVLRDFGFQG